MMKVEQIIKLIQTHNITCGQRCRLHTTHEALNSRCNWLVFDYLCSFFFKSIKIIKNFVRKKYNLKTTTLSQFRENKN